MRGGGHKGRDGSQKVKIRPQLGLPASLHLPMRLCWRARRILQDLGNSDVIFTCSLLTKLIYKCSLKCCLQGQKCGNNLNVYYLGLID